MPDMEVTPPTEWVYHLYGDELAVVTAVLMAFVEKNEDDPEAQELIQTIRNLKPPMRVK
jgi:hypothetical protein